MKRMLVIADLHCGHFTGLTPPQWQTKPAKAGSRTKRDKLCRVQSEGWDWYARQVTKRGPYNCIVVNGDAIDGKGPKAGGTEQITTDRDEQCEMAVRCIQRAMPPKRKDCKLVMTYGTGYHTGDDEDFENQIAREMNAEKIGSHEWVEMEGVTFDFKHHVGGSQIPHGRFTAIARDALWSQLWAARAKVPESHVLIRSHVHYCVGCWDYAMSPFLRLTTPALQGMGTKFGARRCSGLVDFGFLVFEAHRGKLTRQEVVKAELGTEVVKPFVV